MNARPTDAELLGELELSILGRADWVERARRGQIRRAPEAIERAAARLALLEAAAKRLRELTEVAAQ